ncbi:PIN protein [Coleophoma cylindrospora]|uniref:PIN protein n=1 Tax=Coleophoma cylindrospora TaxID=1849047 RepID=A0A3D8SQH8_9HELO|nr:PIN protein [Coleophoma cylindrospora]
MEYDMSSTGHIPVRSMQWGYTSTGLYAPIPPLQYSVNQTLYPATLEQTYEQLYQQSLSQKGDMLNMEPQPPVAWGTLGRARGSSNASLNTNPQATPACTTVLPAHMDDLANMLGSVFKGDRSIEAYKFKNSVAELQGCSIGVEASFYLQRMIDEPPAHEPLLPALGGEPMGLRHHIEADLDHWKEHGIKPVFVFEGQPTVGKDTTTLKNAQEALSETNKAWNNYSEGDSNGAVKQFGLSGSAQGSDFFPILKDILRSRDLDSVQAPYSACAQLAYLEGLPTPYIHGVMGSQELLLYDINDVVILPPSPKDWEDKTLSALSREDLKQKLGCTADFFHDILLMMGTSSLRPFPTLQEPTIISRQPYQIEDAATLLRTSERSVTSMCTAFNDVLLNSDPKWLDNYRKVKMGIRHCVTITESGNYHINNYDTVTGDNYEYLGMQLPLEVFTYMQFGVAGARLTNNFNFLETIVFPTLDGVVSEEYRKLVTEQLIAIKEQAVGLISPRVHRAFKFKDITVKYWFDSSLTTKLNRQPQPDPNIQADTWGVRVSDLDQQAKASGLRHGTLPFALLSLDDKKFSTKTVFKGKDSQAKVAGLIPNSEVLPNALWRLLHLRGYINDSHGLTSWGKALQITYKALRPIIEKDDDAHHVAEAAFLAYELLRFDNLNTRRQHRELIGGAIRGSEEDKASCMLIGRTACLLKLRHSENGYTGPLSKVFLAYHSLIKATREADRDLLEAVIVSMGLGNQLVREQKPLEELGSSLPLGVDIDVGLGIAVKTFLDDCVKPEMSAEEKQQARSDYAEKKALLPLSVNFEEDLDVAFSFFDALHEGVKTLGKEIPESDAKAWDAAKDYLDKRR